MSPPRSSDFMFMLGGASMSFQGFPGYAGLDPAGKLIYRASFMPKFELPKAGVAFNPPMVPDSAPLVRADFDSRTADTLAWLKVAPRRYTVRSVANGGVKISSKINPMSTEDDWAMLPDGTVAIVRARDYHIDWIDTKNVVTSTPKMPFDWKRLTDEEKTALVDSTKRALEKQVASAKAAQDAGDTAPATALGHGMTLMPVRGDGEAPATPPPATAEPIVAPEVVDVSDIPDYVPPIKPGMMRADLDGNVWILPMTSSSSGGGLLYDVVNRKGEIMRRVRLPANRVLEGFGPNGAIYMTVREAGVRHLERARLPQ
jgi:hypothetical protein